jgi:hypothetical protein
MKYQAVPPAASTPAATANTTVVDGVPPVRAIAVDVVGVVVGSVVVLSLDVLAVGVVVVVAGALVSGTAAVVEPCEGLIAVT